MTTAQNFELAPARAQGLATAIQKRLFGMRLSLIFALLFVCCAQSLVAQPAFQLHLADSALTLTRQHVVYDAAYVRIAYPNGDVAPDRGVCSDVVIRAYRKLGIDLQKEVYEDMKRHFALYPKKWHMKKPDPNIDHRRVPNLMVFFTRFGTKLNVSTNAADYQPGDIVCWRLFGSLPHIGIVSRVPSTSPSRMQIIHNVGSGQVLQDCLFDYEIIGHFRYGK